MFEAEFAHKLPELKEREDYLTSSIFGALKYLPPKNGIFPIIGEAFNYKLGKKFNEYFALRGICLEDIKNVELHFWPKSIEYGEPDIIMILHGLGTWQTHLTRLERQSNQRSNLVRYDEPRA